MNPKSSEALYQREAEGTLTWRGPALMLFAQGSLRRWSAGPCRGRLRPAIVTDSMA